MKIAEFRVIKLVKSGHPMIQCRRHYNEHWRDWLEINANEQIALLACEIAQKVSQAFPGCSKCRKQFVRTLYDSLPQTKEPQNESQGPNGPSALG